MNIDDQTLKELQEIRTVLQEIQTLLKQINIINENILYKLRG
jgi:hypothetical protein